MAATGWLYSESPPPPHAKAACPQIVARLCSARSASVRQGRLDDPARLALAQLANRTDRTALAAAVERGPGASLAHRAGRGEWHGSVRCVADIGHVETPLTTHRIVPVLLERRHDLGA